MQKSFHLRPPPSWCMLLCKEIRFINPKMLTIFSRTITQRYIIDTNFETGVSFLIRSKFKPFSNYADTEPRKRYGFKRMSKLAFMSATTRESTCQISCWLTENICYDDLRWRLLFRSLGCSCTKVGARNWHLSS